MLSQVARKKLEADPNFFIESIIQEYIAGHPENRLPDYNNEPIVTKPLVGFASGNDPIFNEFKKVGVVGEFHFNPEEAWLTYLTRQHRNPGNKQTRSLSVISIVFTPTDKTRLSNRTESVMGSPRWQYSFMRGIQLMEFTLDHLVVRLGELGYLSVAPSCTKPPIFLWQIPYGPTSDWSEKHIAYAAGLGTFGLNSGIITAKGAALQCGSVITELELAPTARNYQHYQAYCLYYRNGSCGRCIQRCPSGAITEKGYDRRKCFFYHEYELPEIFQKDGRASSEQIHPICSLCQTKVPCERGIPPEPHRS